MKSVQRFSSFIGWTMILFQAVSLAVVMGVLYTILGRTMAHEHENRLQAQSARVSMALSDRLEWAERQLRDIRMNNAIRINLMLGVDSQVTEQMATLYPSTDGAVFFIRNAEDGAILPPPSPRLDLLKARLDALEAADRFQRLLFFEAADGARYSLFSIPIHRKDERLATAFICYDIAADHRFWRRFDMIAPSSRLLFRTGDDFRNLRAGTPEPAISDKNPVPRRLAFSQPALMGLKGIPDLFLAASNAPLREQQTSLILILVVLCAAVFLLTIWVSLWISRRLSDPLERMADQAMAIAREPAPHFLSTEDIRYQEFRTLAGAFNGVLRNLLEAQASLKNRARQALDASEQKYQRLVETSPTGILSTDQRNRIQFANRAMEEITGHKAEALTALTLDDLVHPDDADVEGPGDPCALRREPRQGCETRWRRKDGRPVWVELRSVRIQDGDVSAVLVNALDITHRKQAETAARQSEEKYRSVVNQSAESIYQVDTETKRIVEANPAMQRLLGYTQSELSAMTVYDFVVHDRPDIDAKMEQILREGDYFIGERHYRKKDGEVLTVEVGGNRIAYGGKEVFSVVCRDITARKKMEVELLKMQKLESLGLLAGGIAHDFNNILTGIIGNLTLAKLNAGPETRLFGKLAETERACLRARDLTQQLLTFAKGGAPLKKTLPLSGLIREAVRFTLRGSNVGCRFDIADDLLPVDADEGQITQVINNLVINAQQAMPDGGELADTAENLKDGSRSGLPLTPGPYVTVAIRDQGPGIPPDQLEKIFDPYFTTKKTGSGLGLAVAYSILKKHGGHISALSEPDGGAAFTLYLPSARAAEPPPAPKPVRIIPGQGRILVMDDEQTVRLVLQEMLRFLGYDPAFTVDGEEAIDTYKTAMAEGTPFDAVIMDLTIPGGMGGLEAIGRLREIDPHVRAIVSSGYASDAVVADFRKHGFSGVLSKPYQMEALSELLSTLTGGAKACDGEAVVEEAG